MKSKTQNQKISHKFTEKSENTYYIIIKSELKMSIKSKTQNQ